MCTSIVTVFHHLDHESGKREKIVVRVTDPGGHFVVTTFVITVLDVNDAPSVSMLMYLTLDKAGWLDMHLSILVWISSMSAR